MLFPTSVHKRSVQGTLLVSLQVRSQVRLRGAHYWARISDNIAFWQMWSWALCCEKHCEVLFCPTLLVRSFESLFSQMLVNLNRSFPRLRVTFSEFESSLSHLQVFKHMCWAHKWGFFDSKEVEWMVLTSSFIECLPFFLREEALLFIDVCFVASPSPRLDSGQCNAWTGS